jgi:hypothetical protein
MDELDKKVIKETTDKAAPVERTYFRDMDKAVVDHLAKVFQGKVPPERMSAMRNLPTRFETHVDFAANYEKTTGKKLEQGTAGYSQHLEAPAHVDVQSLDGVPEDLLHERIHQLSHPGSERILGRSKNEGITQLFTLEQLGRMPEPGELTGWPEERRSAQLLQEVCGKDAIEKAYFQGDAKELQSRLEHHLGGSADRLTEKMKDWPDLTAGNSRT